MLPAPGANLQQMFLNAPDVWLDHLNILYLQSEGIFFCQEAVDKSNDLLVNRIDPCQQNPPSTNPTLSLLV
jgi:hypothetical protein